MDENGCSRQLGNYERYSLARDNTGNPQFITYVATYPSAADLPTVDFLRARARELIEEYPLLKGRIVDGRTTSPQWGVLSEEEVEQGMNTLVYDKNASDLLPPDVEGVISAEFGNSQPLRVVSVGFLWRAVRYVPQVDPGRAYLAVTINHVISDGKSGLALFNALLAPGTDSEKKAPALPEVFPPSMESTIDCRPGYLYMLNVIWKELLIPKLPTFLFNTFKQTPCWPGRAASSHEHRQMFKHIALDAPQVTRLKAMGRKHQVHTLHPILEMAAVVALWQTFAASEIAYDAPISVRDTARGHPPISGNYVANLECRISCSTDGDEQFWDKTRDFSARLSSEAGRRQAISAMGMLVHIPDGANDVAPDSPMPTGWETFLLDKMTRAPGSSLEVSNLGYTRLPPHAERVVFAQTPSPFIPPLVINAVGHERGLELVVCWREGTFAYEGKDGADFAKTYKAVLVYLADVDADNGSLDAGSLSFNDIREAILAHI